MKKLLAGLLVALSLSLPAPAHAMTRADVESLARWAGCRAEVVVMPDESIFGSSFRGSYAGPDQYPGELWIGLAPEEGMTNEMMTAVIFHEIGHCLQYQNGWLLGDEVYGTRANSHVDVELDADRYAAELMCSYHLNGLSILHDLFAYAYSHLGYEGDRNHGSIWERILQGYRATSCEVRPVEAA